ncbi:hypothetical protein EDC15_11814 [Acetobacter aceti NBRC 14818]|nr:hypothetical protein EDC15_11814 [Acetobacter aceti NBRC 14818]
MNAESFTVFVCSSSVAATRLRMQCLSVCVLPITEAQA